VFQLCLSLTMKLAFALCLLLAVAAARKHPKVDAPPAPTFAVDFTASEFDQILQFQGDYSVKNGQMCCPLTSPACQVEVQTQQGLNHFDFTHNRTRWDDSTGQIIVTDFNLGKEMLVVAGSGGVLTCKEFCPVEDPIFPFGLGDNASYVGQKVVGNITTDDWNWKVTIFGIIVMEVSDLFVDSADPSTPVEEIDQLTPLGELIGTATSAWTNWTPGTPDPSLFNVQGADSCPESPNCQSNAHQIRRLLRKQFKTWAKFRSGL